MKKEKELEEVEFNAIRKLIREKLNERYGGVTSFLNSNKGKELGGMKIRPYFYDTGAVNFELAKTMCQYLGIGELSRKLVVIRSFSYHLNKSTTDK